MWSDIDLWLWSACGNGLWRCLCPREHVLLASLAERGHTERYFCFTQCMVVFVWFTSYCVPGLRLCEWMLRSRIFHLLCQARRLLLAVALPHVGHLVTSEEPSLVSDKGRQPQHGHVVGDQAMTQIRIKFCRSVTDTFCVQNDISPWWVGENPTVSFF